MVFRLARKIPAIRNKIKTEMENVNTSFEESVIKRNEGVAYITSLPILGKQHDVIINDVKQYLSLGRYYFNMFSSSLSIFSNHFPVFFI